MKIISAIGSFKGSIDSLQINRAVVEALSPLGIEVVPIPVADGGDGLLDAVCQALNGTYLTVDTVNALGAPIKAKVGIVKDVGVIEMALASGLALLGNDLNPLKASTYGTGLLIKYLAEKGIKKIILGIGGSATNEGGMGCLSALGFEFYDVEGNLLTPNGENLLNIDRISSKNVPDYVKSLDIQIACDVTNPLTGQNGATYVYGRQKGATDDMLATLEQGLTHYSKVILDFTGEDKSNQEGTGAAGGLGFGLMALLNAKLVKGAEIVLSLANFDEKLKGGDLVITGEGRIDDQTQYGKLPQIVAEKATESGVKCIAICGSSSASKTALSNIGITKAYQLVDYAPLDVCMHDTYNLVQSVVREIIKQFE